MKAHEILQAGLGHMNDRAATYDKPDGERSMGATVGAFHAITGHALDEEEGWLFMALLKLVRSQQGAFRADSYEDGAAYFALMGEAAHRDRVIAPQERDGWTQAAIDAAALPKVGTPVEWPEDESRIDIIGQNGPTAEHYAHACCGIPAGYPHKMSCEKRGGRNE